jgi:glutamyl-tRNA reductase
VVVRRAKEDILKRPLPDILDYLEGLVSESEEHVAQAKAVADKASGAAKEAADAVVGIIRPELESLASDINRLKDSVYRGLDNLADRVTDVQSEAGKALNVGTAAGQEAKTAMDNLINNVYPELKKVNERYSDLNAKVNNLPVEIVNSIGDFHKAAALRMGVKLG